MKNGINVLSLFDGLSCGNIALERAGIKVNKYFASEIDKWAIQIANKNYPGIIQLGDVTKFDETKLPKIDLLIGGSPCQGFSFAGKQLNFDDPRSKLFFVYVYMLKQLKPKYFLLENVRMSKQSQDVISEHLGVQPIKINSSLVSGQNRVRLYWTNIPNVTQPEDKGILLKDILLDDAEEPMLSNIYGGFKEKKPRVHTDKSVTIRAASGGGAIPSIQLKQHINNETITKQGKSYALTASYYKAVAWNSVQKKQRTMIPVELSNKKDPNTYNGRKYRKLHPIEVERLQTISDGYTSGVSNTQRFRMLGNSWTADIIAHLFKGLKDGE
jgi:DNA (cytosine-5)-methyltransferase 3A